MSCENCKRLEKRIEQLRLENLEIEERRSRERVRLATLANAQFSKRISGSDNETALDREAVCDLLELLKHAVENPNSANLLSVREQLDKFLL